MNKNKKIGIVILIVLIIVIVIFLLSSMFAKKNDGFKDASEIPTIPKKYGSNEYYTLNITLQELCNIYLNDYISLLSTNTIEAYNALDENYRNVKFGNYNNFINYLNAFYPTISSIDKYKVVGEKYYVYDKNGNLFIFVTNGIMNYKVYLDDNTVEITNFDK